MKISKAMKKRMHRYVIARDTALSWLELVGD